MIGPVKQFFNNPFPLALRMSIPRNIKICLSGIAKKCQFTEAE
jgi:hypothetical protein